MIHKPSQEQLAERFQRIPVELRKAISSATNADALFEIGKKHGLLMDKTGELAAETGLLLLGVTHPDEFVGNLAERLQVDRAAAGKIADDINREIFAPVREHLRAQFGVTSEKEILEEKPLSGGLTSKISPSTISEVRLPKTGRLTSEIPSPLQVSGSKFQEGSSASLEDLEVELERALAEEKGIQPLSVVQKPRLQVSGSTFQDSYKGADPYREQAGEDLPNMRGKAYAPQNMEHGTWNIKQKPSAFGSQPSKMNQGKEKIPPQPLPTGRQVPFPKGGVPPLEKEDTGEFREEKSPFSPLGEQKSEVRLPETGSLTSKISSPLQIQGTDPYHEPAKPTGVLSPFRGFKMNNGTEQPEKKEGDQNKESIM